MLIFGLFILMCLGQFKWFGPEGYAIAYRLHSLLTSKFYESILYYCVCVCPLTQIRHLESTLFYHIGKEKLGSNGLKWTRQTYSKNGNPVPDQTKEELDLYKS